MNFAWEPRGSRFAIVHGAGIANKYSVSFYSLKKTKIKLDCTIAPRIVNTLVWSPLGNYIVFAGLNHMNGILEFYDVNKRMTLAISDHFKCNEVHWAPSGVYVTTACTEPITTRESWRYSSENGFKIWTFQGI